MSNGLSIGSVFDLFGAFEILVAVKSHYRTFFKTVIETV